MALPIAIDFYSSQPEVQILIGKFWLANSIVTMGVVYLQLWMKIL